MNKTQELTPKYWIGHSLVSDDVYLETAAKSYDDADVNMLKAFGHLWQEDLNKVIELFELKIVDLELTKR